MKRLNKNIGCLVQSFVSFLLVFSIFVILGAECASYASSIDYTTPDNNFQNIVQSVSSEKEEEIVNDFSSDSINDTIESETIDSNIEEIVEEELNEQFTSSYVEEEIIDEPIEVIKDISEEIEKEESKQTEQESIVINKPRVIDVINTDIRIPSNLTIEELQSVLLYELKPLAAEFIKAEKNYGINALVLASISAQESGWGRYCFSKNNIFGFYTSVKFSNKSECIDYVAKFLSTNYLNSNGKYFSGYTLAAVNKRYNGSAEWLSCITNIAVSLDNKIKR